MPKSALITGATKGIGLALTENLLLSGMKVFGTGRDKDCLNETAKRFSNFTGIPADLTKNADIQLIADVVRHSNLSLHFLVLNAGMKAPPNCLENYTCEGIDEVMQVNLTAPMKLTALLTRHLIEQSRILYVTSRAATLKLEESSTYCASKAALDEIAAIVRKELRTKQIGVSCVIPGEVDTNIQKTLRETTTFHLHRMFKKAHDDGQLIRPEVCADFLKWVLCDMPFDTFSTGVMPITIYDKEHHPNWLADATKLPAFPF